MTLVKQSIFRRGIWLSLALYVALAGLSTPAYATKVIYFVPGKGGNPSVSTPPSNNTTTTNTTTTGPTSDLLINVPGTGSGQIGFGNGATCASTDGTCDVFYTPGYKVSLSATPAQGSIFVGWSGACSGTDSCSVTYPATGETYAVTAEFSQLPSSQTVALTVGTNGNGIVSSDPLPGMPFGIFCSQCVVSVTVGTPVTLKTSPPSGFTFVGWSGGGCSGVQLCTVTVAAATTVTANFVPNSSSDITLVSALLPTSRSVQVGSAATFFGTMINASTDTTATNCSVSPTTFLTATFFFQTTSSTTNALIGTANTPVTLAPGQAQSFYLSIMPESAFVPTDVAFSFTCANAAPAASNMGLNTLALSASVTPTPDIVALAATATNDGIVDIPGTSGTGAFAVATVNVGATGAITASANDGTTNLPITITICQTNPTTGQCINPTAPATSAAVTINSGTTPTFAIFVKGSGTVPFQPATNRIFVQFQDSGGAVRGSTSVAVRTQ